MKFSPALTAALAAISIIAAAALLFMASPPAHAKRRFEVGTMPTHPVPPKTGTTTVISVGSTTIGK